jgi:hypothetical protein
MDLSYISNDLIRYFQARAPLRDEFVKPCVLLLNLVLLSQKSNIMNEIPFFVP